MHSIAQLLNPTKIYTVTLAWIGVACAPGVSERGFPPGDLPAGNAFGDCEALEGGFFSRGPRETFSRGPWGVPGARGGLAAALADPGNAGLPCRQKLSRTLTEGGAARNFAHELYMTACIGLSSCSVTRGIVKLQCHLMAP